jgi:hypothetical protein
MIFILFKIRILLLIERVLNRAIVILGTFGVNWVVVLGAKILGSRN